MGYKIFKIKLTVLYTTSSISFFLCLLGILGVTPFVPWYGSADCQNFTLKTSNDELVKAVTECNYLAIGLFTTEECVGGNCRVKSNSDINFDEMTKRYQEMRNFTDVSIVSIIGEEKNSTDSENVGGLSITTDFADMHDIEVAGAVSFPFLLLGFLVLALTGLFCFHHLVSESYHVTFGMALFGTVSVFLLLCLACYGGIIGNSSVTDMCDEKVLIENPCESYLMQHSAGDPTLKCEYHETSDLCGFGPGYWLVLLAYINSFISIFVSYITNPDSLEEK